MLCAVASTVFAGSTQAGDSPGPTDWLDSSREVLYDFLWHSAMGLDRSFGSSAAEAQYRTVAGSISPALLWDDHYGFTAPVRFNLYLPLPYLDGRFHAFIGRFDPNEYVTESEEPSGAFRRQYGPQTQDQTLLGLAFSQAPRPAGSFDASAGMRVSLPLDPYVKGGYVYSFGRLDSGRFSVRETVFWERAQGVGLTTRTDVERIYGSTWLIRWTASGTFSQTSQGVLGWSAVDVVHPLPARRAVALELEVDGQSEAAVPLHSYGAKFAYRQNVLKKWLVMELRTSIAWPRDLENQPRRVSPGVGVGFEMLIGTDEFLARPVTF